jgi:hypothetical protein
LPAVRGGWRKGIRHEDRDYLPLSKDVLRAHLTGEVHVGLYPLLDGDLCWWLAADFDGPMAMLDALAYLKTARAWSVPTALEVSRSGVGAHAWVFFTAPAPAENCSQARRREAMAVRGRMDLASYDRLFPSQDVLPTGGVGNLIAAPLHGKARHDGATVFLDLATMEPHDDQWAYLSSLGRMSPAEVNRVARRAVGVTVGANIDKISAPVSTRIRATAPPIVHARLSSGIRLESGEPTPALHATRWRAPAVGGGRARGGGGGGGGVGGGGGGGGAPRPFDVHVHVEACVEALFWEVCRGFDFDWKRDDPPELESPFRRAAAIPRHWTIHREPGPPELLDTGVVGLLPEAGVPTIHPHSVISIDFGKPMVDATGPVQRGRPARRRRLQDGRRALGLERGLPHRRRDADPRSRTRRGVDHSVGHVGTRDARAELDAAAAVVEAVGR